jgi:hypothetical protein
MDPTAQVRDSFNASSDGQLPKYPDMQPLSKNVPPWKELPNLGKALFIVLLLIIAGVTGYLKFLKPDSITIPFIGNPEQKHVIYFEKFLDDQPIASVGAETLYKRDFLALMEANKSLEKDEDYQKKIAEKMIADSRILQGGSERGLINLNSSIFNSINKNNQKRLEAIESVKGKVRAQQDMLIGSTVSIWFNNEGVIPAGYDSAKKIAQEKITQIYNDVKANRISMEQARERIKNDTSLSQVDPAYQKNAGSTFSASLSQPITFMPEFDKLLWGINPGQLTEIYTGRDKDKKTGGMIDSLYIFGRVDKKTDGAFSSFEAWVSELERKYVATYY